MSARHLAKKRKAKRDNYFVRLLGLIICLGAAVSIAFLILSLTDLGFSLTSRAVLTIVLIDIALVAVSIFLVLSNKINYNMVSRVASFALVGVVFFVNLFATTVLNDTSDLIDAIYVTTPNTGSVEYSIVAQHSAGIILSKQTELRAGIQTTDTCKTEATEETKKLAAASFTEYNNLPEMVGATEQDMLDIAVVQSILLEAYAEYFPDSFGNLDVLDTFMAGSESSVVDVSNVVVDITKPFSIYVSGADVFGDINQVARSDANILILIDPMHYKMLLINTPRDYYVQLNGTTGYKDKLTHAGLYGIDVSEKTLEDLYGLTIDYHVRINFDTIVKLVDAIGGIVVHNPTEFTLWGVTYKAGDIYLNGDAALLFSRARKGLAEGDFSRGDNQQRVIEALIDRLTKPHVVIHYKSIFEALSGSLRFNVPAKVITQLFERQITFGGDWTIEKMNAVGHGDFRPTHSMGSQELSVEIPDEESLEEIRAAIRDFLLQ